VEGDWKIEPNIGSVSTALSLLIIVSTTIIFTCFVGYVQPKEPASRV
jgi:hypothetical protein